MRNEWAQSQIEWTTAFVDLPWYIRLKILFTGSFDVETEVEVDAPVSRATQTVAISTPHTPRSGCGEITRHPEWSTFDRQRE